MAIAYEYSGREPIDCRRRLEALRIGASHVSIGTRRARIMGNGAELILMDVHQGVATLKMNRPKKLNGWTFPMMAALGEVFARSAADPSVHVVILTGADPYYCAGVNLGGTLRLAHPRTLHRMIVEHNQGLFELFLDFPKPILVAVNGPAIGASVTSATLCDGIVASERATFSTPFAKLGVAPEGCSSVLFERILGRDSAERMLGPEGWIPSAADALDCGLVQQVVAHDDLLEVAYGIAQEWIANGRQRTFRGNSTRDELKSVNARESVAVADAFLSTSFMDAQIDFLKSRRKHLPALLFMGLRHTRFLWRHLL